MRTRLCLFSVASAFILLGSGALAAKYDFSLLNNEAPKSANEQLSLAKEHVSKMQETLRRVVQLQQLAKKQKDIIKLNCVNDKLLQVKGHLAVTDQAMSSMNEAIAKGDAESSRHEYSRVNILHQKVLILGTEAENCIGEDLSYVGETTVTVEIDPNIRHDDPTEFHFPIIDTTRPPLASPSR
jgi:hypothetical protein